MKYCCPAFKAQVKHGLFMPADFPPDSDKYDLYKDAEWMIGLVGLTKDGNEYRFELQTNDWNLTPMTYCPFCGSKLK